VRVIWTVYRKAERNGDTLDPVSVRAGVVVDGWLPHTARAMAHLLAQGTSREAEATGASWCSCVLAIELRARRSRGRDAVSAGAGADRGGADPGVPLQSAHGLVATVARTAEVTSGPGNAQHRGADVGISGGKTRNGSDEDQRRTPDSAMKSKY
jgi:hypothetical protein